MVGRHQTMTVTAGPHGPLYSARRDGAVLFSNATLNEVRLRYPQIYRQIQPAYAQAGGAEGPIDTIAGWAGR